MFRAYGVVMRLLLVWKQSFLPFSPSLLMFMVNGFKAATDIKFLQAVAPEMAQRLATWPPPLETGPSGEQKRAIVLGQDPMNLVLQTIGDIQVCTT